MARTWIWTSRVNEVLLLSLSKEKLSANPSTIDFLVAKQLDFNAYAEWSSGLIDLKFSPETTDIKWQSRFAAQ